MVSGVRIFGFRICGLGFGFVVVLGGELAVFLVV